MKIIARRYWEIQSKRFIAYFDDKPRCCGNGKTAEDAITNLIMRFGPARGIEWSIEVPEENVRAFKRKVRWYRRMRGPLSVLKRIRGVFRRIQALGHVAS